MNFSRVRIPDCRESSETEINSKAGKDTWKVFCNSADHLAHRPGRIPEDIAFFAAEGHDCAVADMVAKVVMVSTGFRLQGD